MADPREILRDARARMKPLVARMMARRDQAQAELEARNTERAQLLTEADTLRAAGRADLAEAMTAAIGELDLRIAQETEEHARAEADLREALADMDQLEQDEGDAERATLRGVVDAATRPPGDLLSLDPADIALRNVRDHAGNLEARVALDRELAGSSAPAAGAATPRRDTAAEAEAKARTELAALKEARKKRTL